MSPRVTRALTLLGAVLVLAGVNVSIVQKERVIRTGETIYLALAPVDPRSLMQGDYMALRFRLAAEIDDWRAGEPRARRAPLSVDARGVASLAPGGGDLEIAFRIRNGQVWLGTNAYFFSEGTGARYTDARFGEFRIDAESGEAVLVGLTDADLNPL
jgi:uncharacterized membrane-anchored protein